MELLAHASAPSSRKDDERFKRQARAYSCFQSANLIHFHQSQDDANTSVPAVMEISDMSRTNQEPSVYLDTTQDAWTALDSQLYSASQDSAHESHLESYEESNIEETILPPPVDPLMPSCRVRAALPPDESALLDNESPEAANVPPSPSGSNLRPHGHSKQVLMTSRALHSDDNVSQSYLDGFSTINPAETPLRRVSLLRTTNVSLPQDNFSSPSDDIPSQLPSTYSISDINSDPILGDQRDAPPSSEWGSLPRGSAPQPWTGIIEDESPLKGIRSLGKRRVQRSSPLKQTQSLESPRANMSAHVRPARSSAPSRQEEVSSASLDRVVVPRKRQQTEPVRPTFSSSFELRFSSAPQAQGTLLANEDDAAASVFAEQGESADSALRSSFELRFSSAPQAQGTQLDGGSDKAVPTMLRRQSLQQLLPTSSGSQFSSSPEARGTQPTHTSDAAVPAALRQDTLPHHLPTSFESRFSSSPEAQGTPFAGNDDPTVNHVQLSSSPSSKINLFQPGTRLFSKANAPSSSVEDRTVSDGISGPVDNEPPTRSSQWQPTSSASESSSAVLDRAWSVTAGDISTPLHSSRTNKRSLSARIPETAIATKRRKFVSLSTPKAKPNAQEREILRTLSTQINPPPPPTGSGSFTTHITPQLKSHYWDSADLQRMYKPYPPSREVRRSERGFWSIDPGSWNAEIQIKFWSFLQSTIGSGASGWGIWCLRDNGRDGGVIGDEGNDIEVELGPVKVFCWGEVVGHVWLLCYVASQAKLKHVKSQWIDADGEVVIRT